ATPREHRCGPSLRVPLGTCLSHDRRALLGSDLRLRREWPGVGLRVLTGTAAGADRLRQRPRSPVHRRGWTMHGFHLAALLLVQCRRRALDEAQPAAAGVVLRVTA